MAIETAIEVPRLISIDGLGDLFEALVAGGYRVIGPAVQDDAIVLRELSSAAELPSGWGVRLEPGGYQLRRRDDPAAFGHAAGPQSWKRFLHPPREKLWSATRTAAGFEVPRTMTSRHGTPSSASGRVTCGRSPSRTGCSASVVAVRTTAGRRVHRGGELHRAGRDVLLRVDGWRPDRRGGGHDLALSEILDGGEHRFLARAGSERGAGSAARVAAAGPAASADTAAAAAAVGGDGRPRRMTRTVESGDLRDLLARKPRKPRWEQVAERCLTCGNCTMVCPTCFCRRTWRTSAISRARRSSGGCASGSPASRSTIPSCTVAACGPLRAGSRYRQWLTHKFGTWHDQFDSFRLRRLRALHQLVPRRHRRHRGSARPCKRSEAQ